MDQLEKYKKGLLTKEELSNFTDVFMRAKYDDDRQNRWQKTLAGQHQVKRDKPEKTRRIYLWAASAAAAVAIIVFMLFSNPFTANASYEQLADAFLSEEFYENQEMIKGDQDVEQLNLQAIFAYNNKDFSTAIHHYETIVANGAATYEHYFFLGLSYLYTEQPVDAITNLLKVPESNAAGKFIQESRWFLALAYLKNQDLDNGMIVLRSITPAMWKYDEAQQLLEVLQE